MIPETSTLALFALLSCFTLFWGWRRGLFSLGKNTTWIAPINLLYVALPFAIYFIVANGVTPFVSKALQSSLLRRHSSVSIIELTSWLNFINSGLIFFGLFLFSLLIPKALRVSIWRDPDIKHSYMHDFTHSLFVWVISFPVVIFINQISDFSLIKLLSIDALPDQIAVRFLKMTFGHPLSSLLTVFTITVFAPLVEETLFRGFLQSLIRKHLGCRQAIFITSLLFAFFHYSPEQKFANLTIISSLFVFSLFLSLIYEKRRSLFSPICLHATFNGINVLNLYFLGGIPGGPL